MISRLAAFLFLGAWTSSVSLQSVDAFAPSSRVFLSPPDRVVSSSSPSFVLFSKKKGGGTAAGAKKVQVKLLKHVAGTGQAGDVIQVTSAFFNNKLRPTQSATLISDEQVEQERLQNEQNQQETRAKAEALQETLSETTLTIPKKTGPDGKLFGGINTKAIVAELHNVVSDDFLNKKGVKIVELLDENGKKMRGDIKTTGSYQAKIQLTKEISAKFQIAVESE